MQSYLCVSWLRDVLTSSGNALISFSLIPRLGTFFISGMGKGIMSFWF